MKPNKPSKGSNVPNNPQKSKEHNPKQVVPRQETPSKPIKVQTGDTSQIIRNWVMSGASAMVVLMLSWKKKRKKKKNKE